MMKLAFLVGLVFSAYSTSAAAGDANDDIIPTTTLRDGQEFPLVGYGVGNLQHELIEGNIGFGMALNYRLIDTAHASRNEHLVKSGVERGLSSLPNKKKKKSDDENIMHVVTKVWYTHLGYERTKISVRESLETLNHPNIRVHVLLHWPRCNDNIPWMNCEQDEADLPQNVKDAGPAPHLDKENAFKESWRALEDIYEGKISLGSKKELAVVESIGVSNFDLSDLKSLAKTSRITPHLIQTNVWSLLFDPHLMNYCNHHQIHVQVYNIMNGILARRDAAPNAYDSLEKIGQALSGNLQKGDIHAPQVLIKWLTQEGISVIPRTRQQNRMKDNAPAIIQSIFDLTGREAKAVEEAAKALMSGRDLNRPQVSFINRHDDVLHLFWWNHVDNSEVPVKKNLAPGETFDTASWEGHVFVAYSDADEKQRREFTVSASFGQHEEFHIDEL